MDFQVLLSVQSFQERHQAAIAFLAGWCGRDIRLQPNWLAGAGETSGCNLIGWLGDVYIYNKVGGDAQDPQSYMSLAT